MRDRKRTLAAALFTAVGALLLWLLFFINRGIWLVGVSTVVDDFPNTLDNIAKIIVLIASLPWWVLLPLAMLVTAFWVWQTYQVFRNLDLAEDKIAKVDGVVAAFARLEISINDNFRQMMAESELTRHNWAYKQYAECIRRIDISNAQIGQLESRRAAFLAATIGKDRQVDSMIFHNYRMAGAKMAKDNLAHTGGIPNPLSPPHLTYERQAYEKYEFPEHIEESAKARLNYFDEHLNYFIQLRKFCIEFMAKTRSETPLGFLLPEPTSIPT